jgi:hypothetical protein
MSTRSRSAFARFTSLVALASFASATSLAFTASAAGPSKEECLDAHSRGQDAREQGKTSLARKLFLTCAQSACPALVQGDCARFTEELGRAQPTVSFAARDSAGADLPDTTVYVDDVLIATRLDDGKPHDIDPGKHTIRFSNGGRDQIETVIVGSGEKGRAVVATFPSTAPPKSPVTPSVPSAPNRPEAPPEGSRPAGPLVVVGLGGAMAAAGVVLAIVGTNKVPSNCSISTHQCAAPPGDASFDDASKGISMANLGVVVGAVGVGAAVGGLIWYFASPKSPPTARTVTPWVTGNAGGLSVQGHL